MACLTSHGQPAAPGAYLCATWETQSAVCGWFCSEPKSVRCPTILVAETSGRGLSDLGFSPEFHGCKDEQSTQILYVPPAMTPVLQPCDTHVLAAFKHELQETWKQSKVAAPAPQTSVHSCCVLHDSQFQLLMLAKGW